MNPHRLNADVITVRGSVEASNARLFVLLIALFLLLPPGARSAPIAPLDLNANGMSDVWERHYNQGQFFDPANPAHHPEADPDGDGWTNRQESIAGTDPISGKPPEGLAVCYVTHLKDQEEAPTPEFPDGRLIDFAILSWDTLPGKQYTLHFSANLEVGSWTAVDTPHTGDGHPLAVPVLLTDIEGHSPDRLFWRVQISDLDSDSDGLTDHEEILLGSNPYAADTSGDGIPDGWLAVHGFNPTDHHGEILFPGFDVTAVTAYQNGVQDHPSATPDDLDGDGVPNHRDAVPWDNRASWARTSEPGYILIPLGLPPNLDGSIYPWENQAPPASVEWLPQSPAGVLFLGADGSVLMMEDRSQLVASYAQAAQSTRMWHISPGVPWQAVGWPSNALVLGGALDGQGGIMGRGIVPLVDGDNQPEIGPGVADRIWLKDGNNLAIVHDSAALNNGFNVGAAFDSATSFTALPTLGRSAIADSGEIALIEAVDLQWPWSYRLKRGQQTLHTWSESLPWSYGSNLGFAMSRDGDLMFLKNNGLWLSPSDAAGGEPRSGPNASQVQTWPSGALARLTVPVAEGMETRMAWLRHEECWIEQPDGSWKRLRGSPADVLANADGTGGSGVGGIAINHRGEILVNDETLWRNGQYHSIESLVHGGTWSDFKINHINNAGMLAGFATKDGGVPEVVILLPMDVVADTNRDGQITDADLEGKREWKNERGAIYNVNFDRHDNQVENHVPIADSVTWWKPTGLWAESIARKESWELLSEEDLQDITPFQITIPSLPDGTKVRMVLAEGEDLAAMHIFPRRRVGETVIWGGMTTEERPWQPDADIGPLKRDISQWLRPLEGEAGYDPEATAIVEGTYEFGLEGLLFRGMKVDGGTLAGRENHFSGEIEISLEFVIPGIDDPVVGGGIRMKVAPFLLTHNKNPLHKLHVRDLGQATLGSGLFPTINVVHAEPPNPPGFSPGQWLPDHWLQDNVEIGYTQRPGGPVVTTTLVCPRDGGLPIWTLYHLLGPGRGIFSLRSEGGNTEAGGNIELSHPMPPAYPLGRVITGRSHDEALAAPGHVSWLHRFIQDQEIQAPLKLNLDFLEQRHIDEVLSPAPDGIHYYIPDSRGAVELLEAEFPTAESRIGAVFFSPDTLAPGVARLFATAKDLQTMEIVTDLDHATHHQAWQRFLNNEGGYLRLVDHSPDGSAITNPSGGQIARITGLRAATAADQQNLLAANSPDPTGKMVIQIGVVYDVGGLAPRTDLPIGNEKNTWHRRPRHVQGSHHTYLVAVEKSLFWRSKHPAFITVYEFLTNTSLKEYNTETTHGNVGAAVVTLNTVKLIKLPCLFFPAASGSQAAAFTPNLVNLHWMGQSAMLPKPYGPRRASGEDVFEAAAIATGPPLSTGSVFVDTWAKFHLLGGEAHCGGADERVPEGGWWQQLPTNN